MPSTRSSTRRAAGVSSSPASSQDASTVNASAPASKRKGDTIAEPKSKRGRKGDDKAQTKIEDVMPLVDDNDSVGNSGDGDDQQTRQEKVSDAPTEQTGQLGNQTKLDDAIQNVDNKNIPAQGSGEEHQLGEEEKNLTEINAPDDKQNGQEGDRLKTEDNGKTESEAPANIGAQEEASSANGAVQESSKREESTPTSILEKGLIYFFFRGRVGIDEPSDVDELARSYIVLRPIPHGAKLGEGPIGDDGSYRLLALPKKVLPASPKDRFMVFVKKANVTSEEIKSTLGASDYATKTVGTRHTPSATPIGEGVYAITSTGRESHLAYILTIPTKVSEVQQDVGLRERGSFVTSVKNPTYPGPANTNLPQGPDFSQEWVSPRSCRIGPSGASLNRPFHAELWTNSIAGGGCLCNPKS